MSVSEALWLLGRTEEPEDYREPFQDPELPILDYHSAEAEAVLLEGDEEREASWEGERPSEED